MSDHQDSEHFSYDREWTEIEQMLDAAERVMNQWVSRFYQAREKDNKTLMREAARNKKALEGVIKTLRWTLGDKNIDHPLN
jgi:phage shock protein A|tara:strand:- start:337 stop:579 length:243 start_codon:yes stop_codon:yes gene_type:complete